MLTKWLVVLFGLVSFTSSWALPSFTEQTQQPCAACHLSFGELTPYGRKFKLMGYTSGKRVNPFNVNGTMAFTKISNTD